MSHPDSPALVVNKPSSRPATRGRGGRTLEALTVAALLVLAIVVRRPAYLLSHSFWVDEGWVADSVRAPIEQLPLLTSSTPVGWTLLLRAVPPIGGPQHLRLLPLAFAVVSVLPAWWLGRRLGLALGRTARLYGLAAGLAVALVPLGLACHDLKQYTAEACLALVLVGAAVRLEAAWSRRRLAELVAACILAFPFSNTAPFVAAGLLGGLALATMARQAWRPLAELIVAAAAVALAQGAFYAMVASAGDNAAMRAYWSPDFVPDGQGLGMAADFVAGRFANALGGLGLGPWPVATALLGLGLVALARAGLGGVALATPLIAVELLAAATLHRYPLLDRRTSLFITTLWMVLALLGLAWVTLQLTRWRPATVLALAAVVAVAATLVPAARRAAVTPFPDEDVHAIVEYVLGQRQPGDAIVTSHLDAYAFAWYWPDQPVFMPTRAPTAVRFQVTYPPGEIIVARWSDAAAIGDALAQVRAGTRRIWLVVDRVTADQLARWLTSLAKLGASLQTPMEGLVLARFQAGRP
jgi:hypothetical protein